MKKITAIITSIIMLFSVIPSVMAEETISETETVQSKQTTQEIVQTMPIEPIGKVYYVSANSTGNGDGSAENPFSSIENALGAVRRTAKTEPITVIIRGGRYSLKKSLEFTNADSGTESAPITFKAYDGEEVIIHGSADIPRSNISKLKDEALLARLQNTVRDKVYEINLPGEVARDVGNLFETKIGA